MIKNNVSGCGARQVSIGQYLLIVILGVLLSACGKPVNNNASALTLNLCPGFSATGKPPIVHRAECGSLLVPENYSAQDSATISLNILRLPAINPTPKEDPLIIIAGGPGQSAVGIAEQLYYSFEDVRKNRDILFIDQRGTGQSNPLQCDGLLGMDQGLSLAEQKINMHTALHACIAHYGEHLEFYTTPYAVRDLDAVRLALGYEQVNLWGVSYGTRVAMEYMRRYPSVVRTSILDGVAPVGIALPWFAETDALASLTTIQHQCAANQECANRYGDLLQQAWAVAKRLQQPVEVTIEHPATRLPFRVTMTPQLFASAIRMALYSRDLTRILPLAIHQAHNKNYQLITALISMAENRGGYADISMGMHYTVLCNEDYPQYKNQDKHLSEKFMDMRAVENMTEVCELWPRYALPDEYSSPLKSDIPTLLLSGARDPITPPYWAEQVLQGLTNAKHGVAPGGHHSITRDGCSTQLIAQFINTADSTQLDVSCVANILPLMPYLDVDAGALETLNKGNSMVDPKGATE